MVTRDSSLKKGDIQDAVLYRLGSTQEFVGWSGMKHREIIEKILCVPL